MPNLLDPSAQPDGLSELLDAAPEPPTVGADLGDQGRELSPTDALGAALLLLLAFVFGAAACFL